ncbi:MAG: putative sulfate/molybdate transporter [Armatimonadota bacterium]|nr:putative sulfate/molybdate transporter [Armatimonadota bacterium]MDR7402121.1 putative sulfate/molybdate transporter [Armatimonadota bacterium]MDR7404098.1 putative sulfate/molybdate transporter [Armatimonadota bacterium]MDR7437689.1 putative sulfate/molybdate transporter [Armatimonadota bacterium]MDR7472398.1 putative sulfate/molybdate transporter [Armatimonadota bacterium]
MGWRRIRFDRNEVAGAFGDIGTDFPLLAGMILSAGLDPASVLAMFGLMQVATGLLYGLPMPVQPLKAMAVIVITQKLAPAVLYGGGLAVGLAMLVLAATGAVEWVARLVPRAVVRGIQFGLGLQLASLALGRYVAADGPAGYVLAAVAFALTVALLGHRRWPPALLVIGLGVGYALIRGADAWQILSGVSVRLPAPVVPSARDIATGFVVLALPQLPLSLANSVLATRQVVADFFPDHPLTVRRIALTYAAMNLINPWGGGVPTCHGSGGLAGHYAFGARTGGSVVIYGALYLALGVFWSRGFADVLRLFPLPVLGVILTFEALALMRLLRDLRDPLDLSTALLVSLAVLGLPYGYVIGLVVGTVLVRLRRPRWEGGEVGSEPGRSAGPEVGI